MKSIPYHLNTYNIKALRDFILDNNIRDSDSITLSQNAFDDIVLDYRRTFNEGITIPYRLLGILIKEDLDRRIPGNGLTVNIDDPDTLFVESSENEFYDGEIAYRCGWCGNVVDSNGSELAHDEKQRMIRYIEQTSVKAIQKHVHGDCCKDRRANMME